ncbi:hypothetical protein [Flavobacterium sp. N2270]|uniref:hypothetical protein n=1 Tax=Flavobacterium sp. N2270 TaxID=2986831 RepID=UPI002225886B|nr:hypothetical protein [Flavobacterium sp. N2270]
MKTYLILFLSSVLFISCADDSNRNANSSKVQQKNTEVFLAISKKWSFNFPNARTEIQTTLNEWNDWIQFKKELEQKPKATLLAFQMKIENVAQKSDSLSLTVPDKFNNPQVRSRLVTLNTKINSLDTFLHLQEIPQKKVFTLIDEINSEIRGVYIQMDEIIIKQAIPKEIGEDDMIKALDTSRMANSKAFEESVTKSNTLKEKEKMQKK